MKKLHKSRIILAIAIVSVFIALNYINKEITPRTLGQTGFPLKEKWNTCINENIQSISTDGRGGIFIETRTALKSYSQTTGKLIWTANVTTSRQFRFPPKIVDDKVIIEDNENLSALDIKSGRLLWKTPWKTLFGGNTAWIADVSEKFILLNTISDSVIIYDTKIGKKLWEVHGGRGYTQAFIDHDTVYIVDRGVKAYQASNGNLLWEINNERATGLSAFHKNILYYMEYPGNETIDLVAYDTEKQKELWRNNIVANNPPSTSPSGLDVYNDFLYMTQYSHVYRLNPETGEVYWSIKFNTPTDVTFVDDKIYILNPASETIYALDSESGKELGALRIALFPYSLNTESPKMGSTGSSLVFVKGCKIFLYSK